MKNLFQSIKGSVHFRSKEDVVGRAERRRAVAELRGLSDSQFMNREPKALDRGA